MTEKASEIVLKSKQQVAPLGIIAAVIGLFMFPLLEMAAGFIYLVTEYHQRLVDQYCTNS